LKLENLHEARYVGPRSLDRLLNFLERDGEDASGVSYKVPNNIVVKAPGRGDEPLELVLGIYVYKEHEGGGIAVDYRNINKGSWSDNYSAKYLNEFLESVQVYTTKRVM